MSVTYDLTAEAWIPCRLTNGTLQHFSLQQTLLEAAHVTEIIGDSPPVTVALHRLLIAILHRALQQPKNARAWKEMWSAGRFDNQKITTYLTKHQSRFNLFDDRHPFYQTSTVGFEQQGTVARLFFQADANATLFDHSFKDNPPALTPAEAARLMIAFQSFDVGGLKSFEPGMTGDKSADASPLIQSAIALVRGDTLFETLMLNFHRYDGAQSESPFAFDPDKDLPAWERDEPTQPQDRAPNGFVDLLTWQSRRLRLLPEQVSDDKVIVRSVVIMKGFQFPDGFERFTKEPFVAFRKNESATGTMRAWNPIGFNENKSLWRDSLSLFQATDAIRTRPKLLDWLRELTEEEGAIQHNEILRVDFYGLAADQAKLLFWRHEQMMLPVVYLQKDKESKALLSALREALEHAEAVAEALSFSSKELAKLLLAPNADQPNARQPDKKKDVNPLAASFSMEAFYWSRLENPFKRLMIDLPSDAKTDEYGEVLYGEQKLLDWIKRLRRTATEALKHTTDSLDTSARNMKAAVFAERTLNYELKKRLQGYETNQTEGAKAG